VVTKVINISTLSFSERCLLWAGKLPNHVYIGRSKQRIHSWGNIYSHQMNCFPDTIKVKNRAEAVSKHAVDTWNDDPRLIERIRRELKDKVLVCWCKPLVCHGDTYARIADTEEG
jgi:hypothetical protein